MNMVTLNIPEDVLRKVELVAKDRNLDLDTFITDVMSSIVGQFEAEKRFREYAARGKGREAEALALLRRQ